MPAGAAVDSRRSGALDLRNRGWMRSYRRMRILFLFAPVLLAAIGRHAMMEAAEGPLVYVGTYTKGASKGIYAYRFQPSTGKLEPIGAVADIANPSFLAIHPGHKFLYAVSEINDFNGQKSGAVSAYSIDAAKGKLILINTVSSRGAGPCYVAVDRTGRDVLVANYDSGSVAVLPIDDQGRLSEASAFVQHTGSGVNRERQEGPHAHSINVSPDNRFAIVADLGLDRLFVYRFDPAKGSLVANDPPFASVHPGAGPRHFTFHPGGKFAYAINEMQSSVTAFAWDGDEGALRELQTVSTLPPDFKGNSDSAEVRVDPSGQFLYGSNRGHDSIAVFAIDRARGTLRPVMHASSGGKTPRNFVIDPSGAYLLAANQDSNNIVVFRRDAKTGRLTPTGQAVQVDSPVCIRFMP